MSESDTYLDSLLEGMTIDAELGEALQRRTDTSPPSAQNRDGSPADSRTGKRPGADRLPRIGVDPPPDFTKSPEPEGELISDTAGTELAGTDPAEPAPAPAPGAGAAVDAPAEPDSPDALDSSVLPIASPTDILGIAGSSKSGSRFGLVHEINEASATAKPPESKLVGIKEPSDEESPRADEKSNGTRGSHSMADIAREIAATVEVTPTGSRDVSPEKGNTNEESSSLILQPTKRRRARRVNRVAVIEVAALVLLLVVGLAGEYEYVRSHEQVAPAVVQSRVPAARVPAQIATVALTPVRGTVFHFAASGSARSHPFRAASAFTVGWTARCSGASRQSAKAPATLAISVSSSGRAVEDIRIDPAGAATSRGSTRPLGAGVYSLNATAPVWCSWSAQGVPVAKR